MPDLPPICSDSKRLAALQRYGILDTEVERDWDGVCRLAAEICETPISALSFVDRERQWFKSEIGIGMRETPIDHAICRYAILEEELLEIPDTLQDERFRENPFVTSGPHVRFYAGAVIRTSEGEALGTVCVLDNQPRKLRPEQADALRTLARQAMTMLELRRRNRELELAENRVREALATAERANAAKNDFLAKLSHELRTPLTPVLMIGGALLEDGDLPAAAQEDVRTMLRNVALEARLIDDLLDITRITNGKLELRIAPCDLHEVVRSALEVCGATLRERQLDVALELDAPRHTCEGDATRLQQVVWNLLSNAAKFTPPGKRIRLRSRNEDFGWVLEVEDPGRGIEPALIGSLFDTFEQGGREVTRSFGGLGLGLTICKGVIDLHGGQISARSKGAGCGSTFCITLPFSAGSLSPGTASAPAPGASGTPEAEQAALRILLVEDHESTAHVMQRLLQKAGHTVGHANTIQAARLRASVEPFDVVVSDLGLPDGSGLDLMLELRRTYGLRGIALSGYGMDDDVARSIAAGFDCHLTKPVRFDELRAALHDLTSDRLVAVAAAPPAGAP